MPKYQWKRFWCPRDGSLSLADRGYLYDPDSEHSGVVNPSLVSSTAFSDCQCLVMLGEPGIGKSTEFEIFVQQTKDSAAASGDAVICIDLKEYQTDSRLIAEAFETAEVREWESGNNILHLFFDSLDEGRLEVRNIASILAGRIRRLTQHVGRLRLTITCRTAEWPVSLEETLHEVFGELAVQIVELAPLRRCDVIAAAEAEEIAPDKFLADVAARDAEPFAINPITLMFLLNIYRHADELPSTKYGLYEEGCLRLCEESSQSRRDSGHDGTFAAAQRLEVAMPGAARQQVQQHDVPGHGIDAGFAQQAPQVLREQREVRDAQRNEFTRRIHFESPPCATQSAGVAVLQQGAPKVGDLEIWNGQV